MKKTGKLKIRAKKTKAQPEPAFGRVHVQTFKQLRAFLARCTKMILNGELPIDLAKAAVPYIDRIMVCNHSILLQQKIDAIRKAMNLPDPEDEEDPLEMENDPPEPEENEDG